MEEVKNNEVQNLLNNSFDLIAKSDFEGAYKGLSRAVLIEPDNVEIIKTIGLCLVNLERFDEASKFFEKAVSLACLLKICL